MTRQLLSILSVASVLILGAGLEAGAQPAGAPAASTPAAAQSANPCAAAKSPRLERPVGAPDAAGATVRPAWPGSSRSFQDWPRSER